MLFSPLAIYSQNLIESNFPTKNGSIYYTEIVYVDSSMTSNILYLNAKRWIADAFKSTKSVLQTDDKEAKLIIIKSFVSKGHNSYVIDPQNWFTLMIEIKNGRYRYTLYDINYEFYLDLMGQRRLTKMPFEDWIKPSGKNISKKKRQKINNKLSEYCKELDYEFRLVILSLKKGMNSIDNGDW